MIKTLKLVGLFLVLVIYTGCSDDEVTEPTDNDPTPGEHMVYNLPADTGTVGKTTFFRFRDSTIVTGSDTATSNWDIAFRSTTILTNSGSSGPGQGGAVVQKNINFSDVVAAPDTGYKTDSAESPAIPTGSANGWYLYDFANNLITPIPGVVLFIRTGDGKYAKVQILSYYEDAPEVPDQTDRSRFYTFKYFYQPDGSKSLR